jgi:hypothetical protein
MRRFIRITVNRPDGADTKVREVPEGGTVTVELFEADDDAPPRPLFTLTADSPYGQADQAEAQPGTGK